MKKCTGYNLINPCQTIVKWVGVQIKELIKKKMGSDTKIEQNDFKVAMEQFTKHYQKITAELNNTD